MSNLPAVIPLTEADYELIESAVMETVRGRWFLAEYARRNRHADTTMLLAAMSQMHAAIQGQRTIRPDARIRFDLLEMGQSIARAKAEMAGLNARSEHHGNYGRAEDQPESIVQAVEAATSKILAAAEQIEDIVWTLREQGLEADLCDVLDSKVTEIYAACSDQDLIAQRTGKLIEVMRYLEGQIDASIASSEPDEEETEPSRSGLTSTLSTERMVSDDVVDHGDRKGFIEASASGTIDRGFQAGTRASPAPRPAFSYTDNSLLGSEPGERPAAPLTEDPRGTDLATSTDPHGKPKRPLGPIPTAALARIEALSPEEKIALFS
jgi:chemotaxis protein CheZ